MPPPPMRPCHPPSHTTHQGPVISDCVVFYIRLFCIVLSLSSSCRCFILWCISPCPLPLLVASASSIIVLQRAAQAGRGVQRRRAPGDPRIASQFTGFQVKEKETIDSYVQHLHALFLKYMGLVFIFLLLII